MNVEEFLEKLAEAAVQYPMRTNSNDSSIHHPYGPTYWYVSPISIVHWTMFPECKVPLWAMSDFDNARAIGLPYDLTLAIMGASENYRRTNDPDKIEMQNALRERILIAGNVGGASRTLGK